MAWQTPFLTGTLGSSVHPYVQAVLNLEPVAYYRLNETSGSHAIDATAGKSNNLLLWSSDLTEWTQDDIASVTDLGGGEFEVVEASTTGGGPHRVRSPEGIDLGGTGDVYTVSIWVQRGTGSRNVSLNFRGDSVVVSRVNVDLGDGSVLGTTEDRATVSGVSVVADDSGWRISWTNTLTSDDAQGEGASVYVVLLDGESTVYDGDGSSSIIVKEPQVTVGDTRLPYQPTGLVPGYAPGNHGTIFGAELGQEGVVGTAYSFDGVDDRVDLNDTVGNYDARVDSYSVAAWFKVPSDGTFSIARRIFQKRTGTNPYPLRLIVRDSGASVTVYDGSTVIEADGSASDPRDDQWHFLVGVVTPDDVSAFYDGSLGGSVSNTASSDTSNSDTARIGTETPDNADAHFEGDIDEVAIFDKALTPAQIADLWQKSGMAE